jgi:hypothetical protein
MTRILVHSPEMAEIAKELRKRLAAGEIRWDDAMKIMKTVVREALRTQTTVIRDGGETS